MPSTRQGHARPEHLPTSTGHPKEPAAARGSLNRFSRRYRLVTEPGPGRPCARYFRWVRGVVHLGSATEVSAKASNAAASSRPRAIRSLTARPSSEGGHPAVGPYPLSVCVSRASQAPRISRPAFKAPVVKLPLQELHPQWTVGPHSRDGFVNTPTRLTPTRVDLSVHYTVGRGLVRSCRRAAIGAVLHVPVSPTLTEIDRAPHPDVCQSRGDRR